MSALSDELEDLEQDLGAAKEIVGTNQGPLDPQERNDLEAYLDSAQVHIAAALAIIDNIGTPGNELPDTLPEIAVTTHSLADDAYRESTETNPVYRDIGNYLKTIDWMVDAEKGYKDKAGIED